jgi:hypothetical protein
MGENVRVEAADVHAEFGWHETDASNRSPDLEIHARSDHVAVVAPGTALGPWRVDVDRANGSTRVRVALDPGVPDSCTVLVVSDGEQTTSVDIAVPRSPLAHLGLTEPFRGLNEKALQVEAVLHYVALGPTRIDATARGGIYGIQALGLPRSIDVAWEGAATGDPTAGVDVRKARLAVGPLVGAVTGTLKRYDDGFRVDLAWAAGPVPCTAFAAPMGLGKPFDIGYEIRKLGLGGEAGVPSTEALSSAARVRGTVSAAVILSFDSRDLLATKLEFTPEIGCSASFFQ